MRGEGRNGGTPRRSGAIRFGVGLAVLIFMLLLPTTSAYLVTASADHRDTVHSDFGLAPVGGGMQTGPVKFIEDGLPSGTPWSVNLSGSLQSSNSSTITFSEEEGTYAYTVPAVADYVATPSSGNVTLRMCSLGVSVYVTFTPESVPPAHSVTFVETGLNLNTSWWVEFNGTNVSSEASSISFPAANGTYIFTDAAEVSGGSGIQFVTNVTNGTATVDGTNITITIPYSTEFFLTMIAYPGADGNVTPSSGWEAAGASVHLTAVGAAGFSLINWTGGGNGSYSGPNATPTITMNSPIVENATFGAAYGVDFQEHGLLDGVVWSVTFNGATESAYFVFLDFTATNGTYNFTVAPISGFHADIYGGIVTVNGTSVTVLIDWTRVTYNVTFAETGLPSGTSWSVTLNNSLESSLTSQIIFVEPNGTIGYTVGTVSGYSANVTGGSIDVQGANLTVYLLWTANTPATYPPMYNITFLETGLPNGTSWSVALNSTSSVTLSSTTATVVFSGLGVGMYTYWVPNAGSYTPATASGSVSIVGSNVTVDVSFTTTATVTSTHPSTTTAISLLDLLIVAFIIGAGVAVTYLIFRRT